MAHSFLTWEAQSISNLRANKRQMLRHREIDCDDRNLGSGGQKGEVKITKIQYAHVQIPQGEYNCYASQID